MIFLLFNYIVLAISSSIDSLGIGISYGIRNTKLSNIIKIILFFISLIITDISILIGKSITLLLPLKITNLIGSSLIIFIGLFILFQNILKEKKYKKIAQYSKKVHSLFIKNLGITIKIIREPISSDLDNSNTIDIKEAIYLGIALSLDAFCIGLSSFAIGLSSYLFPIFSSSFQILFLSLGIILGKKITKINKLPSNIWSIISGILLVIIGLLKIF